MRGQLTNLLTVWAGLTSSQSTPQPWPRTLVKSLRSLAASGLTLQHTLLISAREVAVSWTSEG